MASSQLEKRKRIMQRSIALGHCICDPRKPCPCDIFKEHGVCECAGERMPIKSCEVRLTETVRSPGCSSKISKRDLKEVLKGLSDIDDKRVVVGRSAGDDAGVIMIDDATATILTVDVFSPSVDDPYTFGQIAAANSVSDIYAMGGVPQAALSIIGFPIHSLPRDTMREILRGGIDKMSEAGICVIGGHSINDEETKCGFAVVGTSPKEGFVTNEGAQVGDVLVLTKPLGVAIVAFANQIGRAEKEWTDAIGKSMASLNKIAGLSMKEYGATAATDVTGFSLLGHMSEIARKSNVEITVDFDRLPVFPGVKELSSGDAIPGGVERNRESVPDEMLDISALTPAQQAVLFCPETSGGLLVFMPQEKAESYVELLRENGVDAATVIGRVSGDADGGLIIAVSDNACGWEAKPLPRIEHAEPVYAVETSDGDACCCSSEGDAAVSCCNNLSQEDSCCCGGGDDTAESGCSGEIVSQECCAPVSKKVVAPSGFLPQPAAGEAFNDYMGIINKAGALGVKEKKLMSLALSVLSKCEPCVKIQARAAREAGASEVEIAEAVALAISFGGAPVNMFYRELLK